MTIDETWIHRYTLESKQQAKQWAGPGRTALKRAMTQQGWQGHAICFLGFQWHIVFRLFGKEMQ